MGIIADDGFITFKEKLSQVDSAYSHLKSAYSLLEVTNVELVKKIECLTQKIIELEDKLNINSSNSGLPSSKEIYKAEKKTRPQSDRKPGGQVGHEYHGYQMKPADERIELIPEENICRCGGALSLIEDYKLHQKIEIPTIKPIVTEYKLHQKICGVCKKKYKAKPENNRILGKNIESIICGLGGFFNNSKREIQEILSKIFNLDISLGLISNSEGRISTKIEAKYKELQEVALESDYLHMDETGSRNKGKRSWCWMACNDKVTLYKLANSRGKKALISFLPSYEGKVISDRYGVYNIYEKEKRQICLAHLRRDFKRFAHSRNKEVAAVGLELVGKIDSVFINYNQYKARGMEGGEYYNNMRILRNEILGALNRTFGIAEAKQAQGVANNIVKSFEMMWLFLEDERIEPTNNFAERQIKNYVKYRKNSFFTWSERGDRFLERVKSVYATAKLQNLNPFLLLQPT